MSALLIVAALKDEIRPLLAELRLDATLYLKPALAYRGTLFNREVTLLVTGIGRQKAETALEKLLAFETPKMILQVGYAGGASPVVAVGEVVVAGAVYAEGPAPSIAAAPNFVERLQSAGLRGGGKVTSGGMLTVDRVVLSPHEKADLGVTHRVLALDMESYWTAQFASRQGIDWLVAKAVLDPIEMELPNFSDSIDSDGEIPKTRALQHFARQPRDVLAVPKLRDYATQARNAVFRLVESWMTA